LRTAGLQGSGELTVLEESEVPKRLAKVLALLPVWYLSAKAISGVIVAVLHNRIVALVSGEAIPAAVEHNAQYLRRHCVA
jgi:hypothetical protein